VAGASILERLTAAGRSGVDLQSLLDGAETAAEREARQRALETLQTEGTAVEWNGRWIAIQATEWIVGTVQRLERGDAVLRSGSAGEAGYFIARRFLKSAQDGDLVLAALRDRKRRRRRTSHRLPEVTVLKVLAPRVEALVGVLEAGRRGLEFVPFDPRIRLQIDLSGTNDLSPGTYVVATVSKYDSLSGGRMRAEVQEVLGSLDEPGVDVLACLRHFAIPDEFPPAVSAAAEELPTDPASSSWQDREDLREHTTITIDGASARDFDDAISLEERPDGGFLLGVHIADVSHYVAEGGVLDLEAYRRGTSVYFPDRAVPMLPERLSNGLCSLRPDVPRLTLSAFLEVSKTGEVISRRFCKSAIISKRRLTYSEVCRLLEEPEATDEETYGEVLATVKRAERLMRKMLARRSQRGSIDFDLPEGSVVLDLDGAAIGVRPGERNVAHRIIEEFMIAANEAVALELEGNETPALYRVHDEPDRQRLHELRELLEPLGIPLDVDADFVHPRALQAVMQQVEGRPAEPFVASLVLRSMKRARYEPDPRGHYALSSRHYTHFTSPIRRYPDLLIHRQLKSLLAESEGAGDEEDELLAARLPTIAEHTSSTEARAERAERLILHWKVVRFLAGREGESFAARITGVKPYGLFLQLTDLFVDGLLPIANLRDDFYEYRAERHELVGRKGKVLRLADAITVTLEEVDLNRRRLLLGLPPSSSGPTSSTIES
jgi:ribonuclease R